jgi:phosphoribosylanthranilate isomerase
MTRIKICGLSRPEDVQAVNAILPDYIGFVFAPSRRQVTVERARALKAMLDERVQAVGVFVDAGPAEVTVLYDAGFIDMAQLYGDDSSAVAAAIKADSDLPLVVAQGVSDGVRAENSPADYLLYDHVNPGSGRRFDWKLLAKEGGPAMSKPFFLAGGITVDNIDAALALKPTPFCVDVSSGAETNGVKDPAKIARLVAKVRSHP